MHSPTVEKGQSYQIQRLSSLDMLDLVCKTKSMSTLENLTKATQTKHVQAGGLNKLGRLLTLTFIKVTTLDIG